MDFTGADFGMVGEGEFLVNFLESFPEKKWDQVPGLIWRQEGGPKLNRRRPVRRLDLLPRSGPRIFYPAPVSGYPGKRRAARHDPGAEPPGLSDEVHLLAARRFWKAARTRAWAPEQVASWLAAWHGKWGLNRFFFVDNIFNCPVDYGRRLCQAIAALRLPLEWGCLINPAFPDRQLFELIGASGGVMVQVGNESGSELMLNRRARDSN